MKLNLIKRVQDTFSSRQIFYIKIYKRVELAM